MSGHCLRPPASTSALPSTVLPPPSVRSRTSPGGWVSNPNMLLYYAAWGDQFDARAVRNARTLGALPVMAWEPFKPSIADIADGVSDDYIRRFAMAVQALNLPVAISFAHEMNGFWYPWGTEKTSPADFVRAWRHIARYLSRRRGDQRYLDMEPKRHQPSSPGPAQAVVSRRLVRGLDRGGRLLHGYRSEHVLDTLRSNDSYGARIHQQAYPYSRDRRRG